MATNGNNVFWREFFELYRTLPETWKIKSEEYKNKNKKDKAYSILLEKYKEIEPYADINTIKAKINSMKTSYRRELNKNKQSERSGAGTDDLYIPSFWYFTDLKFLEDQEGTIEGVSSMDEERIDCEEISIVKKNKKRQNARDEFLQKAMSHLENSKKEHDEANTICSSWAVRFRQLSPQQKLFANKSIEEVLYRAALGQLNENSYKCMENPMHIPRKTNIASSSSNYSARASTLMSHCSPSPISYDESSNQYITPHSSHQRPVRVRKAPYKSRTIPSYATNVHRNILQENVQQTIQFHPNTTNIDENEIYTPYEEVHPPPQKVFKYNSIKDLFMDKDFCYDIYL